MATVLPGPASKENGGCVDCGGHGLLAYGAGSSIVVVDVRSMQLVIVLSMPAPRASAAPYVTAVQWLPESMLRSAMEDLTIPQLQLAAGDRHGRIALWDVNAGLVTSWLEDKSTNSNQGIQHLCWLHAHPWLLAAIHGTSLLVIWDPYARAPIWRYDEALGDSLTCVRCDPLNPRQLTVVSSKGLLLAILVTGRGDKDVLVKPYQLQGAAFEDSADSSRPLTRESTSSEATAFNLLPKCAFSSAVRGILYIIFSREIVVFDLQFGMSLSSVPLPRGCAKLMDVVTDVAGQLLLLVHVDGKLSTWKRKECSQVFAVTQVDSLMPSLAISVPPPSILAARFCPLSMPFESQQSCLLEDNAATFISISDDGRLWEWVMRYHLLPSANAPDDGSQVKLELTGQLHLLPSSVTTLAVCVPLLLSTISGGGNAAGPCVPLIALATQSGTIELIDTSAGAVTSSFCMHSNAVVRGVRWLGSSRVVSFSYTEVKGKGGGFINRLVLTCIRSGQSRSFRVLQKPERAPMRALRTSPSGRYMLILFREAPAEVWAMTKNPQMLRSLALPFTVMEWALPPAPKPLEDSQAPLSSHRPSLAYRERPTIASTLSAANASAASDDQAHDETAESFAFALVNGSLGVFELRGRRVRDFKPKWPASSFVSTDVLVTAMAYRMPHVVMGDRIGRLRWWDVTSGSSSSFNTHRGGIRRIKFAPVSTYDTTRGRVAVLFNDNTFAVYDLDTQDPLANSIGQPGILVLELDWFPVRTERQDPLLLCLVGADSSFRMLEIQPKVRVLKVEGKSLDRSRPMPVYSPGLLPSPHALALRMLLQVGVSPSWFSTGGSKNLVENRGDLRHFLLETNLPTMGDPVALEVLLKALEPYRKTGRLLDAHSIRTYATVSKQGCAARLAFAAAYYGHCSEARFWLQLPTVLHQLASERPAFSKEMLGSSFKQPDGESDFADKDNSRTLSWNDTTTLPGHRASVFAASQERIAWHKMLPGYEAVQKLVHEHIAVGDFEAAVTLLLATPPENPHFYVDALRAVALAASVSPGLHELAIKVVAANMVATEDSLCGTHLLCAVGRYQEACSQLQDAGRWEDACTLASSKLSATELARVLERWAEHVLQTECNIWKALTLFVSAGALPEALLALNAQYPHMAVFFLLACHEAKTAASSSSSSKREGLDLPGNLVEHMQDVDALCEFYAHYQRRLSQLCNGINLY